MKPKFFKLNRLSLCHPQMTFKFSKGLAVGLSMHPANGTTVVTQVRNDNRDYLPETPSARDAKKTRKSREQLESLPKMHLESELLSINDYPTRASAYSQVIKRLQGATWPIRLRLRRPLFGHEVVPLQRMHELKNQSVRLQSFKRLLLYGLDLKLWKKGKAIDSRLWLTSTFVNWREEKLCSPYTKLEYGDPRFSKDAEMKKFLSVNRLKHLERYFLATAPEDDPEENINSLEQLCEYNGQRVIKGNYPFPKLFSDLGITNASDHEMLFRATSRWIMTIVGDNLSTQDSRSLYDVLYVRLGKDGSKDFSKTAADGHCFTLHFDVPKHTIRVGEETKGYYRGHVSAVLDDKVVITTDTGEIKKLPTKKAMQYLSVSLTFRVCLIIAAIPHRLIKSISMPLPPSLPPSLPHCGCRLRDQRREKLYLLRYLKLRISRWS